MTFLRPRPVSLFLASLPMMVLAAARFEPVKAAPAPEPPPMVTTAQGPQTLSAAENGVGRLIAPVTFTDLAGKSGSLKAGNGIRATVIAFTSSTCPVSKKFAPALGRLEAQYAAKNVRFIYVDPIASDTPAELKAMAKAQKWRGPVVRDTKGTLQKALNARVTTEAFVLDGARTLVYRGAVSDQYGIGYARDAARHAYLAEALDAVLSGTTPAVAATGAPGCALLAPAAVKAAPKTAAGSDLTYYARISRLMQTHCVECHHTGGIAPFPLDTLESVRGHAAAIGQAVERRAMPPWSAAPPPAGHETVWANDRTLPRADRADLMAWINGRQAVGNPADAPLPRSFATGWKIGKPDAIFALSREVAVKAEGQMPYVNINVPTEFTEDKWVTGLEIQPSSRAVVHHVLVFAVPNGPDGKPIHSDSEGLDGFLAAYVPGTASFIYPEGFAKKIPAGTTLRFQMHYTPNGVATTDRTRLGLKFASKPPEHEVRVAGLANVRIDIPPGAAHHGESAEIPIPFDAKILALMPHMHFRGSACRYTLTAPDGTKQDLLDVPHYDFNWQHCYRYATPVSVAKGSRLEFTGWFDNSAANPANPDPKKNVRWGPQTTEEMLLGYVEYYTDAPIGAEASEAQMASSIVAALGGLKGITALFHQLDKDQDGKLSPAELPRPTIFKRLDTNSDGFITMAEVEALAATGTTGKQ